METKRHTARPISPRRELIRRIRTLPIEKIEILLNTARSLDKTIEELETDIKTGAYRNWTASEYKLWDSAFVKLTPDEAMELKKSKQQFDKGEYVEWKPGMFTES